MEPARLSGRDTTTLTVSRACWKRLVNLLNISMELPDYFKAEYRLEKHIPPPGSPGMIP